MFKQTIFAFISNRHHYILIGNFLIIFWFPNASVSSSNLLASIGRINPGEIHAENLYLKSYDEILHQRSSARRDLTSLYIAIGLLLIAAIIFALRGRLQRFLPVIISGRVSFKLQLALDEGRDRLLLRLRLNNGTNSSKTFNSPNVLFRKGSNTRVFKINSDSFPITLTPGTMHKVTVDVQKLYDKVSDLDGYNKIGASIELIGGGFFKTTFRRVRIK